MMTVIVALIAGLLFGGGLAISQMMDPAKVLSFLDVAGQWDPSLMLVMGGALALTVPGFRLILKRPHPILDGRFHVPDISHVDARLLVGSSLFGLGWGLAGLCPGPAIAGLVSGAMPVVGFVIMMLLGYRLMDIVEKRQAAGGAAGPTGQPATDG